MTSRIWSRKGSDMLGVSRARGELWEVEFRACFDQVDAQTARHTRCVPSPACGQGNRICVNKTGISLLLDSVRSVNDSYLFTHMRLPCACGGGLGWGRTCHESSWFPP